MGAINFSLDKQHVDFFLGKLPIEIFVETGSFHGDTIESVKNIFPEIHSIEISKELFDNCAKRFEDDIHVHLYHGKSPELLRKIRKKIKKNALFWLDAHWCEAINTGGKKSQCPLIDEIKAITPLREADVVFIDDARLFTAPPPFPHEVSDWPDFNELIGIFGLISKTHSVSIINDVICVYPKIIKHEFLEYSSKNNIDLTKLVDKANKQKHWEHLHSQAMLEVLRLDKELKKTKKPHKNQITHEVMSIANKILSNFK